MSAPDGGPAFPTLDLRRVGDKEIAQTVSGLTVLDYFAAKAMQSLAAPISDNGSYLRGDAHVSPEIARAAYLVAAAMLAERAKTAEPAPEVLFPPNERM